MVSNRVSFLTDLNEYETDMACGMKLWYTKCEGGYGVVPKESVLANRVLHETHNDLRNVAEMEDLSVAAIQDGVGAVLDGLTEDDKKNVKMMEVLYRRLGWFAAWALFIEPKLREVYDNVPIDPWVYLDRDPLWVTVEPDRVLRNRSTKEVVYWEYIPTTVLTRKWLETWEKQPRPQVGMAAVREHHRMVVNYAQIRALAKGFIDYKGKLIHPYVYGKFNKNTGEFVKTSYTGTMVGFEEKPIWEYKNGIVQWVLACGEETAHAQFSCGPRIDPEPQILVDWVAQRLNRERTINAHRDICQTNRHLRSINFVKNPGTCNPLYGDECQYKDLCYDKSYGDVSKNDGFVPTIIPMQSLKSEVTV